MATNNNQNQGILEAAMAFAKSSPLGTLVGGIVIIILTFQLSGFSVGTMADKWFGLEEKKLDQSYELQLKTFDFLQGDVMDKLDDIYGRLDNVEEDVSDLKKRVSQIESDHRE